MWKPINIDSSENFSYLNWLPLYQYEVWLKQKKKKRMILKIEKNFPFGFETWHVNLNEEKCNLNRYGMCVYSAIRQSSGNKYASIEN